MRRGALGGARAQRDPTRGAGTRTPPPPAGANVGSGAGASGANPRYRGDPFSEQADDDLD